MYVTISSTKNENKNHNQVDPFLSTKMPRDQIVKWADNVFVIAMTVACWQLAPYI